MQSRSWEERFANISTAHTKCPSNVCVSLWFSKTHVSIPCPWDHVTWMLRQTVPHGANAPPRPQTRAVLRDTEHGGKVLDTHLADKRIPASTRASAAPQRWTRTVWRGRRADGSAQAWHSLLWESPAEERGP